jgi:nucleoside-diphosphate-sugar epimerase
MNNLANKRFLVIGGNGYIGTAVLNELLSITKASSITCLDRNSFELTNLKFLKEDFSNINFVEKDVRKIVDIAPYFKDVDVVIHLAGLVGDPSCSLSPSLTDESNVLTQEICIQLAVLNKVKRFVFASSASVYGIEDRVCDEDLDDLQPISKYAVSKLQSEQNLLSYSNRIQITVLRYSTVYGVSARFRLDLVVNRMLFDAVTKSKFIINGPKQIRPFVHVVDLARATVYFSNILQKRSFEVFNIGSRKDVLTFESLGEIVFKCTEVEGTIIEENPDARNYAVSFSKAENYGFQCIMELSNSVEEIANFIKKNSNKLKIDKESSNLLNLQEGLKSNLPDYQVFYKSENN